MADPLSITAGIIAVIGAAGKTAQGLQKAWELRHMDEDFLGLLNEITGLRTQLQAVDISLQQSAQMDLNESLRDYYHNIGSLCLQARAVLVDIDEFVQRIISKKTPQQMAVNFKISKKRWLQRRSVLMRLTAKVTPIVTSLTAASSVLRDIASDQKFSKLDLMVANITLQNVELLRNRTTATTTTDEMSLETKLGSLICRAIELEGTNKRAEVSSSQLMNQSSRRSSIDSFHSALSSSSESAGSVVSITGTLTAVTCEPFCPCQCHISAQMRTPSWAKHIFGSMTVHGNGSILLNRRPCNKSCQRSGPASLQVSYFAPAWTLLKSLNIYVKAQSMHAVDFTIRAPRIIPRTAAVWSIIELGRLSDLQDMASQRLISPYDVAASGRSLLNYAAVKGQNDIYKFLLSLNADPDFRDESGMAANQPGVDRALSNTSLDRIVSHSARAFSYDLFINSEALNKQEFNFLHLIVLGLRNLDLNLVLKQCLSHQSDIDAPDVNGRTPLAWAAWRGDLESVELLLSSRADPDRADNEGYTAIARAAKAGHLDCVRRFLIAGASISITDKGGSQPIHHASSNKANGLPIVNELLAWGADPNASSDQGSPLHLAANRGSLDTVKRLLQAGADINAQDSDGDSPAMVALLCWNQSAFIHLVQAGARLDFMRKTGENVLHLVTWAGSTDIWSMLAERAHSEQTNGVDIRALHNGHELRHCFERCRELWYVGEREERETEEIKFGCLIEAFEAEHTMMMCAEETKDNSLGYSL